MKVYTSAMRVFSGPNKYRKYPSLIEAYASVYFPIHAQNTDCWFHLGVHETSFKSMVSDKHITVKCDLDLRWKTTDENMYQEADCSFRDT